MRKQFDQITPELAKWPGRQRLFFLATAPLAPEYRQFVGSNVTRYTIGDDLPQFND